MEKNSKDKPRSMNIPWSEADDQMLRELVERGTDGNTIARALGRTRASVFNRKAILKIEGKIKRTPKGKADPLTYGTITKRDHSTTQSVAEFIPEKPKEPKMKNKPDFLHMRWSEADDQMLKELIARGADGNSISRALGRTRSSIFSRKTKLGIEDKINRTPKGKSDPLTYGTNTKSFSPATQPVVDFMQDEPKESKDHKKPKIKNKPDFLHMRWSEEDDQMLKKLIARGEDSNFISRALGRTRTSIFNRKSKLGIEDKIKRTPKGKADPLTYGTRIPSKTHSSQVSIKFIPDELKQDEEIRTRKSSNPKQRVTEIKTERGRLSQTAKLAQINRRLRRGDVRKVAQKTGFTEGFVSAVLSGCAQNERVINVAFSMVRGRKTNEQMMKR